jgi:hypothetical protein
MRRTTFLKSPVPVAAVVAMVLFVGGCGPSGELTSTKVPADREPTGPPAAGNNSPLANDGNPEKSPAPAQSQPEQPEPGPTPPQPEPSAKPQGEPSQPAAEPQTRPSSSSPEATPPAKPDAKDDDGFDPKELEENRKLVEKEMAEEAKRRAEQQKKRIAELGPPLVDNQDKLVRLDKVFPVWTDPQGKRVVMVGEVCQRRMPLEMFACLRHTKEHEAVVVVDTTAQIVHAGLLAVGAKPGRTVQFNPKYISASGDEIEVTVVWKDSKGKVQTARAQEWIRNSQTKKAMEHSWVFAGSAFSIDQFNGRRYYLADGGDFICVSNFPTAMLDLPIESSSANAELQFEAFTERIPDEGTPVTLILTPKQAAKPQDEKKPDPAAPSKGDNTPVEKPRPAGER